MSRKSVHIYSPVLNTAARDEFVTRDIYEVREKSFDPRIARI